MSALKSLAVISCFIAITLGLLAISLAQIDYPALRTIFGWLAGIFISISAIAAMTAFFISFSDEIGLAIDSLFGRLSLFHKRRP